MGTMVEFFHSEGRTPVEREELKIRERGSEIDWAVALSMLAEMASGPAEVSGEIQERRLAISSEEHSRSGGHEKGGGEKG